MDARKNNAIAPFVITRTFDAPRDLVFAAFAEPERLREWWGPAGTQLTRINMDFRVGGVNHYCLRLPNGGDMWGRMVYREIDPPRRIVWVNSFSDPEGGLARHSGHESWPLEMLTIVTFEHADAGKTRFGLEVRPLNASEAESATFDQGRTSMTGGWTGSFEQLDAYLRAAQS